MTDTFKTSETAVVQDPAVQAPQEKDLNSILSKRLDDSQDHIKKIHSKLDLQNEVIEKQNKLIEQFLSGAQNLNTTQQEGSGNTSPAIDPSKLLQDVQEVVSKTLKQEKDAELVRSLQEQKDKNFESVASELTARYGEKVDEVVAEVAKENDMTFKEALEFAKEKPKLFLKLFPQEVRAPAGSRSSVNTSSLRVNTKPVTPMNPRNLTSMLDRYKELEANFTKNRG